MIDSEAMSAALLDQGNAQILNQDYRGAIATFTEMIQADEWCSEAYGRRAVAYFRGGNIHAAVSDYGKVLELDPKNAKAFYGRALARLSLKNPMGALTDVNQALQWQIDYAAAHKLRATIHRRQGNYKYAIADFKQAAKLYLEQRKAKVAQECIESVKQIQEQLHRTRANNSARTQQESWTEQHYFHHILNLTQNGDTDRAMQDINWVLRSDPKDGKAHCCRGLVHLRNGKAREAIADLNQAIALNFTEAIVYRNRSKARLQLGDYPGAVLDCNQALSLEEDALSFVARGNAHRMTLDYMSAIEDYDAALGADETCGEAHFERGMTYEALEKFHEAVQDYQQAISLFCLQENWQGHKVAQVRLKVAQESLAEKSGKDEGLSSYARLYQKLLNRLEGSQKVTEAVLRRKKNRYPGRSEEWYIESAIEDLDRSNPSFWGTF